MEKLMDKTWELLDKAVGSPKNPFLHENHSYAQYPGICTKCALEADSEAIETYLGVDQEADTCISETEK